jgi:hypothetical protein
MKWLTKKSVVTAARRSHKAAVECSLKHWNQLYRATQDEIVDALSSESDLLFAPFCALCTRYLDKNSGVCNKQCPLSLEDKDMGCGRKSLWEKATDTLCEWWGYRLCVSGNKNLWKLWKQYAKEMRDKLEKSLKEVSKKTSPEKKKVSIK